MALIGLKVRMPVMAFTALETAAALYFSLWLLPYMELVHIFPAQYSAWNYPAGFAGIVLILLIALKYIEKVLKEKFSSIESTMRFEDLPVLNLVLSLFCGALTGYIIGGAVLVFMALSPATGQFLPEYNNSIAEMAEKRAMNISHVVEVFSKDNQNLNERRHDFLNKVFFPEKAADKKNSKPEKSTSNQLEKGKNKTPSHPQKITR